MDPNRVADPAQANDAAAAASDALANDPAVTQSADAAGALVAGLGTRVSGCLCVLGVMGWLWPVGFRTDWKRTRKEWRLFLQKEITAVFFLQAATRTARTRRTKPAGRRTRASLWWSRKGCTCTGCSRATGPHQAAARATRGCGRAGSRAAPGLTRTRACRPLTRPSSAWFTWACLNRCVCLHCMACVSARGVSARLCLRGVVCARVCEACVVRVDVFFFNEGKVTFQLLTSSVSHWRVYLFLRARFFRDAPGSPVGVLCLCWVL